MQLGVLGGGQLARMLAMAAHPLGVRTVALDPSSDACAGAVADLIVRPYDDPEGLDRLGRVSDIVTSEFESVPAESADRLAGLAAVRPNPRALAVAQDRLHEKRLFAELGIDTPRFEAIASQEDIDRMQPPGVLKTRRLGYDGKGQLVVREESQREGAFEQLGGVPLIWEELVPFERELSIVAARGVAGSMVAYRVVENHHRDGILRVTYAPAPELGTEMQALAEAYARRLLAGLDYVGVLAVELFQLGNRLMANEMAPRVHNSGHWTIEGAETSQFENHVRAVCGLPLGSTAQRMTCTMVNLIGGAPDVADLAAIEGAHVHLYDKSPRKGRKIGHVTVTTGEPASRAVAELAEQAGDG
jgi:5-(carboxyamino)imidazole ribonucleotide synthase